MISRTYTDKQVKSILEEFIDGTPGTWDYVEHVESEAFHDCVILALQGFLKVVDILHPGKN